MQKIHLLPAETPYYKANLHCHTCISDGRLTPDQVKELYRKRGYRVVAFTDHRVYQNHTELNDKDFIAIAAMETDLNEFAGRERDFSTIKTYHINWYDTDPDFAAGEKSALDQPAPRYHDLECLNGYVEKMRRLGFLACYNHPYWSLQSCEDYCGLRGLWGMEIYNHGCEMDGLYGYHPQAYDEMLRAGQRLFCVASDDNHNGLPPEDALCDSFGGYVMIGAREFTYAGIMSALKRGDFYSVAAPDGEGEGPEIRELSVEGNTVYVKCSPAEKIFLKNEGRRCGRAAAERGNTITEAEFALQGNEGYIRAEIRDAKGRSACSNAYFVG